MAQITLGGNPVHTVGDLPAPGDKAPTFELVKADFGTISSEDLTGSRVVLNIFPSLDTGICATSVRTFNQRAAGLADTTVVCVSADLPTAAGRFCAAEGIEDVVTGSTFRSTFPDDFGVRMTDGKLQGLNARAVVVLDRDGTVLHSQLLPEIAQEPDYDAAVAALG
jgi:thiol peroxidase